MRAEPDSADVIAPPCSFAASQLSYEQRRLLPTATTVGERGREKRVMFDVHLRNRQLRLAPQTVARRKATEDEGSVELERLCDHSTKVMP